MGVGGGEVGPGGGGGGEWGNFESLLHADLCLKHECTET